MARLTIDTGTAGNPATGDTLRTAMTKVNANFDEVYQLVGDGSTGLITTAITNGDLKLQANGTGVIEVDQLQINGDAITSIVTNSSVDITGNGTGGVNIEALTFNGTSISSTDSSRINLNENVTVDGDLIVTGSITGTLAVSAEGSFTIYTGDGSTSFSATAGNRYGIDTSGGTATINLPGSPTAGDAIYFADAGGAFGTNNLTIGRNGNTIQGLSEDMTVSTNNASTGLFYTGSTWRIY